MCVCVAVLLKIEISIMWCVCGSIVEDRSQQHVACVAALLKMKSASWGVCVGGSVVAD